MKFIKTTIVASIVMVLALSHTARSQAAFEKGKSYVSLGYGYQILSVKTLFQVYEKDLGFSVSGFGPIRLNYEYAVTEKVGIGLNMGYTSASVQFTADRVDLPTGKITTYNYKYKYSKLTALPRLNFHLGGDNEKIDPYIGFGIGFKKVTYAIETLDPDFSGIKFGGVPLGFEATFGCRFLFTPALGGYVELGAGHGFAQVGMCAKF